MPSQADSTNAHRRIPVIASDEMGDQELEAVVGGVGPVPGKPMGIDDVPPSEEDPSPVLPL